MFRYKIVLSDNKERPRSLAIVKHRDLAELFVEAIRKKYAGNPVTDMVSVIDTAETSNFFANND